MIADFDEDFRKCPVFLEESIICCVVKTEESVSYTHLTLPTKRIV